MSEPLEIRCPYFRSISSYGTGCQIRCGGAGRQVFDDPELRYTYQQEHCSSYHGQQSCPLYAEEVKREDAGDVWTSAEDPPLLAEGHRTVSVAVEVLLKNNDKGEGYYDYAKERWFLYDSGEGIYRVIGRSNPVELWRPRPRRTNAWMRRRKGRR